MSTNSYREFESHIKKGLLDKAYLFSGRDKDRKGEAIASIEAARAAVCDGSLAVIKVQIDESSPEELAAYLFTVPLFEKFKLIIIPRVEGADKGSRDILLDFVKNPPGGLCLVVCTDLSPWE